MDTLTTTLVRHHPDTAATILEQADPQAALGQLQAWPVDVAVRVLERMLPHAAGHLLLHLESVACADLIHRLPDRVATRILQQIDEDSRAALLERLPPEVAAVQRRLVAYPRESAGALMDTRVATLRERVSIGEAIEVIRHSAPGSLHYLYVVDDQRQLCGVLMMRDVLLADPATPVADIMRRELITVSALDDRQRIIEVFTVYGYAVLPVVDDERHLLGVVHHDAVIEASADAAYDHIQQMVGVAASERPLDPVLAVVKGRFPWLLFNLAATFLAAAAVGLFESTIAMVTALAVLLPVVAGQSAVTGAQTLAVVMRGLLTGDVRPGLSRRILWRQVLGAVVNACGVAMVSGLLVWIWDGRLLLAIVIALAMVLSMVVASIAGVLIPMTIAACGRDPARSSSVLLTTITDVVGFVTFLGLATLVVRWLV